MRARDDWKIGKHLAWGISRGRHRRQISRIGVQGTWQRPERFSPDHPTIFRAMTRIKGVVRIDSKHTHGWQARVSKHLKPATRFFSDGVHGDMFVAFVECALWVEDWHRRNRKPYIQDMQVFTVARSNTGILGVTRQKRDGRLITHFTTRNRKRSRMLPEGASLEKAKRDRAALFREEVGR